MRKIMLLVMVLALVAGAVSAQWKDYEWGMSPKEVDRLEVADGGEFISSAPGSGVTSNVYRTTLLGYQSLAYFVFSDDELVATVLIVEALDVFERVSRVFENRWGDPIPFDESTDVVKSSVWDEGSAFVILELTYSATQITYAEHDYADRVFPQASAQDSSEL